MVVLGSIFVSRYEFVVRSAVPIAGRMPRTFASTFATRRVKMEIPSSFHPKRRTSRLRISTITPDISEATGGSGL